MLNQILCQYFTKFASESKKSFAIMAKILSIILAIIVFVTLCDAQAPSRNNQTCPVQVGKKSEVLNFLHDFYGLVK